MKSKLKTFNPFKLTGSLSYGVRIELVPKIMRPKHIKSTMAYARIKREVLVDTMEVFDRGCTQKPRGTNRRPLSL